MNRPTYILIYWGPSYSTNIDSAAKVRWKNTTKHWLLHMEDFVIILKSPMQPYSQYPRYQVGEKLLQYHKGNMNLLNDDDDESLMMMMVNHW